MTATLNDNTGLFMQRSRSPLVTLKTLSCGAPPYTVTSFSMISSSSTRSVVVVVVVVVAVVVVVGTSARLENIPETPPLRCHEERDDGLPPVPCAIREEPRIEGFLPSDDVIEHGVIWSPDEEASFSTDAE